jgi:hypothetical protein
MKHMKHMEHMKHMKQGSRIEETAGIMMNEPSFACSLSLETESLKH